MPEFAVLQRSAQQPSKRNGLAQARQPSASLIQGRSRDGNARSNAETRFRNDFSRLRMQSSGKSAASTRACSTVRIR